MIPGARALIILGALLLFGFTTAAPHTQKEEFPVQITAFLYANNSTVNITENGTVTASEGDLILLSCSARGPIQPDVSWRDDGFHVSSHERNNGSESVATYNTGYLQLEDHGHRLNCCSSLAGKCRTVTIAVNKKKAVAEELHVTLRVRKNDGHYETRSQGNLFFTEGDKVTLVCVVEGNNPGNASWQEDGMDITSNVTSVDHSSSAQHTIDHVTPEDDDGRTLDCITGDNLVRTFTLRVKEQAERRGETALTIRATINGTEFVTKNWHGQQVFTEGDNVTLACYAHGNNHENVSWMESGIRVESKDTNETFASISIIELPNIATAESGRTLACVSFAHGEQKKMEITLTVNRKTITTPTVPKLTTTTTTSQPTSSNYSSETTPVSTTTDGTETTADSGGGPPSVLFTVLCAIAAFLVVVVLSAVAYYYIKRCTHDYNRVLPIDNNSQPTSRDNQNFEES